jgi:sterol 3beta-glucosyltransferase
VHHAADVTGFAAALVHGKARVTGTLMTDFLPGTVGAAFMRFGARFMDGIFNPILASAGLARRRAIALELNESPLLNLVAVTPLVVAPHRSWRGRWLVTGYWFLDETEFAPDPALATFVGEGTPPVVVTFGSMPALDARKLSDSIVAGITSAGARAVLQSGIASLGEECSLPDSIHWVRYVPYDWLLPRSAGIVHHGGAGTCAAALRAGVPQAIVWHLGDQKTWGTLMRRCGVAVPAIFHRTFSSEWLASTVRRLRTDEALRDGARHLGDALSRENGVARAVEAIGAGCQRQGA